MSPDLGRRAVACKHWTWRAGMRCDRGAGWFRIVDGYTIETPSLDIIPDLTDPATLGCLLALVREAWPVGTVTTARYTYYTPERGPYSAWACTYWRGEYIQAHGDTEAEALVAALETAP